MLLFKKKFLAAIRAGEKTQTIRLWKHRRMRAGQRSYIPGIGPIRLTAVDEVDLDGLTDADARPDGFEMPWSCGRRSVGSTRSNWPGGIERFEWCSPWIRQPRSRPNNQR